MPNPTLYDNFSQVKQYIDQNQVDLSSYVTKSELSDCSYATQSYVVDYVAEHGGSGEVTYSYLNDNYLPLSGGNMSGQLSLNNNVKLHIGSERPWEIYEGGTGGTAYLCLQNAVDGKHFYLKDVQGNNIVDIHNNLTGTGSIKFSYNLNTYTNSIVQNTNYTYTLGNSNYYWSATYSYIINIGANNRFKALDNYNVCFYMGNSGKFNILSYAIRPSSSGGMNLGTNDYPWAYTYTNRVNFGSNKVYIYNNGDTQMKFGVNNADRFRIDYNSFVPSISGAVTQLGTSNNPFTNTYTSYLYTDTVYLQDTSYTSSIIPKETTTYTLGNEDYLYSATYSSRLKVGNNSQIYNDGGGITLSVNSNAGIRMGSANFYPKNNNGMNLGQSSNKWNSTYTSNLYADTAYLQDTSYSSSIIPNENNTYTLGDESHLYSASYTKSTYFTNNTKIVGSSSDITFYTGGLSRIKLNNNILRPDRSGVDLGSSSNQFTNTYTSKIWFNSGNAIYNDNTYQIVLKLNNSDKYVFRTEYIRPISNNGASLGLSNYNFSTTYTSNLYLGNSNIKDLINGMFSYDSSTGTLTITTLN